MPNLSLVCIHGGRDDQCKPPIFDDVWILRLHNMEYVRVQIGGMRYSTPRCNHGAFVEGSQLVVFGGQNDKFMLQKSVEMFELD